MCVPASPRLASPANQGYASGEPKKRANPVFIVGMLGMLGLVGTTIRMAVGLLRG
jgi:hypothetical protein